MLKISPGGFDLTFRTAMTWTTNKPPEQTRLTPVNFDPNLLRVPSGEEARRLPGPTPPDVAEAGAAAHPEGPSGQPDDLHRRQVRRLDVSRIFSVQQPCGKKHL